MKLLLDECIDRRLARELPGHFVRTVPQIGWATIKNGRLLRLAEKEFEIERLDRGEYRLVRRAPRPNEGLVNWLLACPEKEFFVPVESESTDTL